MRQPSVSHCPDEETLAAFVEGRLSEADRGRIVEHVSRCEDCIAMIDAVNETVHTEPEAVALAIAATRRGHWQQWLAAAAVLRRSHAPPSDAQSPPAGGSA